MFWNDIKDIRELLDKLSCRLEKIEEFLIGNDNFSGCANLEYSVEALHGKLNDLINDKERLHSVALAEKTLDKFEEYMKNVDKLNGMINELKGCTSMARSAVIERKESNWDLRVCMNAIEKNIEDIAKVENEKIAQMTKMMRKIAVKLQIKGFSEKKSRKKKKVEAIEPDFPAA